MIIYLPALVALIGLVMYLISNNPKVVEIGRIMFFAGLLAFLFGGSGGPVRFPGR